MVQYSNEAQFCRQVESAKDRERKPATSCSNLDFPVQQIQTRAKKTIVDPAFVSVNVDSEANRVFPFQATPSGNLKIIPNQVRKISLWRILQ